MARRIVVGVDGSSPSKAALAWAGQQAELTGAVVEAVIVWEFPASSDRIFMQLPDDIDFAGTATKELAEAVAEVFPPGRGVTVTSKVTKGHPGPVLLDASQGADLLVIGNRGRGGLARALLGSVSLYCVEHATCPVTVIRDGDGAPGGG
jgi:nucleotide-binding universal stress UspA family protein